jgi:UDP-N-acetylglucosamine/UDP-N-acetylgalactosamine diphosphorylase
MMPSVDFEGRLILSAKDRIFMNPNGHGGVFPALKRSGALEDMEERGITQLFYFQVDNPLVKIADPLFIGYHLLADADMSTKVVKKENPEEKVGVLGYIDGALSVIEYSELSRDDKYARRGDGELKFNAGNTAIHLLNVEFIRREIEEGFKLPYHAAKKKIPYIDEEGNLVEPDRPNGLKFETFIFDALRDAKRSINMEIIREEEFSPLKNKEGADSPESVKEALVNLYANWCEAAGVKIPRDREGKVKGLIEISPLFALDRENFVKKVNSNTTFNGKLCFE